MCMTLTTPIGPATYGLTGPCVWSLRGASAAADAANYLNQMRW